MKKMRHISLVVIFVFLLSLIAVQADAFFDNHMKKGQEHYSSLNYELAVESFTDAIREDPKNIEAYRMLGMSYKELGNWSKAQESFTKVVANDAQYNHRVNDAIKDIGTNQFVEARPYLDKAIQTKPELRNKLASYLLSNGQKSLDARRDNDARQWFSLATYYNAALSASISDLLIVKEKYDFALEFTSEDSPNYKKIGLKFLEIAADKWPSPDYKRYKNRAIAIVGEEKVEKILPSPYLKITFTDTYTYADAFEKNYGQVKTFRAGKHDVKLGDKVTVTAKVIGTDKFSGKEISVIKGGKWVKTDNGHFSTTIDTLQNGKYYIVSLSKRRDIEFSVTVKRKVVPEPRREFFASLY